MRTLGYDTSHRLTGDQWAPTRATFTYDTTSHTLTAADLGTGTTLTLAAAAAQGLQTSPAQNASAFSGVLSDALGHVTSYVPDVLRRRTGATYPDGGVEAELLNFRDDVTRYADPLNHVTSYGYDTLGNRTLEQFADGGVPFARPGTARRAVPGRAGARRPGPRTGGMDAVEQWAAGLGHDVLAGLRLLLALAQRELLQAAEKPRPAGGRLAASKRAGPRPSAAGGGAGVRDRVAVASRCLASGPGAAERVGASERSADEAPAAAAPALLAGVWVRLSPLALLEHTSLHALRRAATILYLHTG